MAVISNALHKALVDAGVFQPHEHIVRFVIDAKVDEPVKLYVQRLDTQPLEEILPRELRNLEAHQIFGTSSVERTEVGEPETERETRRRVELTGQERTQGEERVVTNGGG